MGQPELTILAGGKSAKAAKPRPPRAKTLQQAIADDDEVAAAKALRLLLGKRISDPKTSAVAVAALTKQFRELGEKIAELEGGGGAASKSEGGASSEPIPDEPWDDDI